MKTFISHTRAAPLLLACAFVLSPAQAPIIAQTIDLVSLNAKLKSAGLTPLEIAR